MEEKVSVVIPIYNCEKYILQCIESIQNQTYKNLEIIIVDDGSTDNSSRIVEKLSLNDNRIKLIKQPNSGVSSARNNGILASTGKFVTFCDSDDFIAENHIMTLYELISANDDCQLSIVSYSQFLDNNGVIGDVTGIPGFFDSKSLIIQSTQKTGNFRLLASSCNKLYITEIIKKNDVKFNSKINYGEDWLFVIDYLRFINFANITKQKTYFYRQYNSNTLSSTFRLNGFEDAIKIRKILADWIPDICGGENFYRSVIGIHKVYQPYYASSCDISQYLRIIRKFYQSEDLRKAYRIIEDKKSIIGNSIINNNKNLFKFFSVLFYTKPIIKRYILKIRKK